MKKAIALLGILAVVALARWGGGYGDPKSGHYWWWDNQPATVQFANSGDIPPIYWGRVPTEFGTPGALPAWNNIHLMPVGTQGFHKADEPQAWTLVDSMWYYGKWYKPGDKLYMSPDGWISFEHSGIATNPSSTFPFDDNIPAIIGPYWADLAALGADPVTASEAKTVYFRYDATIKQLTVEWYQVPLGSDPTKVYTFEAVIQFGGQAIVYNKPGCGAIWSGHFINFLYNTTAPAGIWFTPAAWLVGIEDQSEAFGLTVDGTSTTTHDVADGRIVRFGYGKIFRDNVAAWALLSPGKLVLRYTKIEPKVIVKNIGQEIVSFPLTFKIDSVGGGTVYGPMTTSIFSLAIGAIDTAVFPCWDAPADVGGHYRASYATNLDIDECRGDDTLWTDVWVGCDDTLAVWHSPFFPESTAWSWGSDKVGFIDGNEFGVDPFTSGYGFIKNGALLQGAVLNIVPGLPDNNYGQWSIQVHQATANGWPPTSTLWPGGVPVPFATNLRPPAYTSGSVLVPFSPAVFVPTAASGLGASFWLFYASDGFAGQYDMYRQVRNDVTYGTWYSPSGFAFNPGPSVAAGWYNVHYEPIYPPPNNQLPCPPNGGGAGGPNVDLKAITHLALRTQHLAPCYAKWERDLTTTSIDMPNRIYMQVGSPITPKSTIANIGRNTEPDPPNGSKYFYSYCTITNTLKGTVVFAESTAQNKIGWLGNGADNPDTLHLTFSPFWTPDDGGKLGFGIPFEWKFDVKLGIIGPDKTDHCPYNNALTMIVTSLWKDDVGVDYNPNVPGPGMDSAAVNGLLYPLTGDSVLAHAGGKLKVKARIRNYGYTEEGPFNVECVIKDMWKNDTVIYTHWYQISFLDWRGNLINNPDSVDITFPEWLVPPDSSFKYRLTIRTLLPNDLCPANDFQDKVLTTEGVNEPVLPLPKRFELSVIHPNPFFTSTEISYALPVTAPVSIKVYDATGKLVTTLVDSRMTAGTQSVRWDGRDAAGRKVAQGVYVVRMNATDYSAAKKIILLSH